MASWLESYSPRRFDELAMPEAIQTNLQKVAVQANPPHLILAGPAGVGKTAAWRLIARQILLEASYPASGTGVVRVIDADMNLNPEAIDNFAVDAWSDSDAGGIDLTVTEIMIEQLQYFHQTVDYTRLNMQLKL
jgi:DNA polymerase III delta prime subunit